MNSAQTLLRLDQLPTEIITSILNCVAQKDLLTVAQLSTWFRNLTAPLIKDRIRESIIKEGWRIHISLLTKSEMSDGVPHFHELSLLGNLKSIDPRTLRLTFDVHRVDKDGFSLAPSVATIDRETVFFAHTATRMELLVSFAKVAQHRIEHVNEAGIAILDTESIQIEAGQNLKKQVQLNEQGKEFLLNCHIHQVPSERLVTPDDLRIFVEQYKDTSDAIVVEITSFQISPVWWFRQMTRPTVDFMLQHSLW
ncbi:hypothetical protein DFQ28_011053 [Apophysomyces sp. BC1034]|nr:hypothetical protein DFQ30_010654 [Apophysomyces sp. BC1015]KAG0181298.1 hypothetical protein DFQ29_008741 [Apophysomyces sp. BC1021]KAG0191742.1 hypothetical protein DFQ28_011053 [Apophysomyces sp. BC1034]